MSIRRAVPGDLDAIAALEASGFEHGAWTPRAWADEIAGTDRHVLVAEDAGLVGVATFQCVADTADLHRVVVAPERRGAGIGGALVRAGLAWAAAQGADRMLLEVDETNAPARALYARLGFAAISRRADYYGEGRHALVLSVDLPAGPATETAAPSAGPASEGEER